jgi:sugar phosphate isomerase/epimerase
MWMQHRFVDVRSFAEAAQAMGFQAIELSHIVTPEMVNGLSPGEIEVASLHYPAPHILHGSGVKGDKLLTSPDEDARRWAVVQGYRSMDYAQAVGAGVMCLHLGWVEMDTYLCWALEQRYQAGHSASAAYEALRARIVEQRAELQAQHLEAARRSLDELAAYGARAGVRLGLENRRHIFEIPTLAEMRLLLAEHDPGQVGFWYDTGHAQVLANLGFDDPREWLAACADRIIGVHFHDNVNMRDHLIPSQGDVDFVGMAHRLPCEAIRVCEFDWYFERAEVEEGREYLERAGCFACSFD